MSCGKEKWLAIFRTRFCSASKILLIAYKRQEVFAPTSFFFALSKIFHLVQCKVRLFMLQRTGEPVTLREVKTQSHATKPALFLAQKKESSRIALQGDQPSSRHKHVETLKRY